MARTSVIRWLPQIVFLLVVLPAVFDDGAVAAAAGAAPGEPRANAILNVRVVGIDEEDAERIWRVVRRDDGDVLAPAGHLDMLGFRLASGVVPGDWVALSSVPGVSFAVDEGSQELRIRAQARSFRPQHHSMRRRQREHVELEPRRLSLWANYHVAALSAQGAVQTTGGLEVGLGTPAGLFENDALVVEDLRGGLDVVRLSTRWTWTDVDRRAQWRVGDDVTNTGQLGRPLRFAGVRYASDFTVTPGFVPYPVPEISGQADLPSIVEIYADEGLRARQEVRPGAFTIDDVALLNGAGDLRVVVRDYLGRERIVSEPFYISAGLLKPGLSEFSYQAGVIRRGFGAAGTDYGEALVSGFHRRGLTDRWTGELGAAVLEDQQALSVGSAFRVGRLGSFDAALSASNDRERGSGAAVRFGFDRAARRYSLGWRTELAERAYVDPGSDSGTVIESHRLRASLRLPLRSLLSLAVLERRQLGRERQRLYALAWSGNIAGSNSFSVSLSFDAEREDEPSVRFGFVHRFDGPLRASLTARTGVRERYGARVSKVAPRGVGLGYSLAAEAGERELVRGDLTLRRQRFAAFASLEDSGQGAAATFDFRGSVAWLGGRLHLARQLLDGFGLVRVSGTPGVAVYSDNRLVGRTNRLGEILVPEMRPYQPNRIRIGIDDLPVHTRVLVNELEPKPRRGYGAVVEFDLDSSRAVLLELRLPDGTEVPIGAEVVRADGSALHVAMRGQVFLEKVRPGAEERLEVRWSGGVCVVDLLPAPALDVQLERTTAVCEESR